MELTIEKLVYGGEGLARMDAEGGRKKTVFVPLVLPGEHIQASIVEERPGFARARLDRVLQPAPERTSPPCPYFSECGGCHYQHATYEAQLEFKKQILRETVERIAKIELPQITAYASPPLGYRNRTRMRIGMVEGKFAIGYYRMASHSLLPIRECPISSPLINHAIQAVWSVGATSEAPRGLSEIEFAADNADKSLIVVFLMDGAADEKRLREWGGSIKAAMPEITGVAAIQRSRNVDEAVAAPELDGETSDGSTRLLGLEGLKYKVGEFGYRVSAGSFFQTNRFLAEKLVELVTAGASGRRALDLYAGVGLFTLPLAQDFERVTAVEAAPSSFQDLVANAPDHVKAIKSTTEAFLSRLSGSKPDFVVVDPPRSGLGKKVTAALAKLAPEKIAYVSCDPSTLSRDLPALVAAGYKITKADLVDLFPQTFHLETVLRLER
jgi:23S rRNA (uracil1939-C5)-methyltransferase